MQTSPPVLVASSLAYARTCLEFIYPEIGFPETMKISILEGAKGGQNTIYNPDIAYWVGYTYHQLFRETDIAESELVKLIPFDRLEPGYLAHHTLDEEISLAKLCDSFGLKRNERYVAYERLLDEALISH